MFSFLYNFLYYIVSVVIALFFICFGLVAILLPWSPYFRTDVVIFILENSITISLFGYGFVVVGITLLIGLYLNTRRKTYYMRTGKKTIAIDEEIVQQYLNSYWQRLYPNQQIPSHMVLKKNRIKVVADLPYASPAEQKTLMQTIQEELQDIFSRLLGYSHELVFAISFQRKPR